MNISIIVALSKNRVIGINNDLPWHLPDDMKFFKEKTEGHVVVMGRKNYESIPERFRPLPKRINVVLTRNENYDAPGCEVFSSFEDARIFAEERGENELFVIGGGQIYLDTLQETNTLYLTEIDAEIENGEVFFPELGEDWLETERHHHAADDRHKYAFDFVTYKRA